MNETTYMQLPGETDDEFLLRMGKLKESHQLNITWTEFAIIMNSQLSPDSPKTESYWRKRYRSLLSDPDFSEEPMESERDVVRKYFDEVQKQRIRARDERQAYSREVRSHARMDEVIDLFSAAIEPYQGREPNISERPTADGKKAMYVMLSDLHYGLAFDSIVGKYDSEIAWARVREYAKHIKEYGVSCSSCYVSLMGDMISGLIHPGVRIENKENLIEQVVGVSELVSEFLFDLASYFEEVYVNSVDGNHSRPDPLLENTLRKERLDALVPWYCKAKLSGVDNVHFAENVIDTTVGSFNIMNHLYVCVHGDMEKNLKTSAQNISKLIGKHIDYFLAGHTHVPEFRFEDTRYITNGCVCGSGDDYTIKKRLFGPPVQVCMICSERGVEAVHPIELGGAA